MSDQVLYRKYRSGSFAEVVGQDHVVQTLTAAIAAGRLAHAYLFTGPRGTGKTSVARLLARAANCTGDPKPCGACELCQTALNSTLDIIEIDAASNRSIESIRELRDKVAVAPSIGSRKVYIIDEVHMLTTEAFNALLKTLEEPPAHVMFILATTEAHKVPETIASRTQRLNFRPIRDADLIRHLRFIAQQEGITIDDEALAMVAAASRGGFRDAISILDQLSAGTGSPITTATVRAVLGYASLTELHRLAVAIASGQTAAALELAGQLAADGAAPAQTALGLMEIWRQVMRAGAGLPATSELPAELSQVDAHRAAAFVEACAEVARSGWPELALEATIVKLTTDPASPAAAPTKPAATAAKPPAAKAAPAPEPPNEPAPAPDSAGAGLAEELWPKVVVLLKAKNNSLGALLQMYPADFGADEIIIKPRFNFHRDLFMKAANRALIETAASKVYGRTVRVSAKIADDSQPPARRRVKSSPDAELVSSALEILGGEVID
ncbi:MAG TPA: DNA polymerase III subunit gamma/tau [Candidatus Saccharimonadia bacterium]